MYCEKCGQEIIRIEEEFKITTESHTHIFCKVCIKNAADLLGMKIIKTSDEKKLLKHMRKFLRYGKKN